MNKPMIAPDKIYTEFTFYSYISSRGFPLYIFDIFSHFLYIFKILWYNKAIMIPAQN